jgi:hypothetical protein
MFQLSHKGRMQEHKTSGFWKGLFLGVVLKCKIAGGPSVSVGMWPILG